MFLLCIICVYHHIIGSPIKCLTKFYLQLKIWPHLCYPLQGWHDVVISPFSPPPKESWRDPLRLVGRKYTVSDYQAIHFLGCFFKRLKHWSENTERIFWRCLMWGCEWVVLLVSACVYTLSSKNKISSNFDNSLTYILQDKQKILRELMLLQALIFEYPSLV